MWQVKSVARPRRRRAWRSAGARRPAVVLGLSPCSSKPAQGRRPTVITQRGTPSGDGRVSSRHVTSQTHSPENLTMAYVLPNEGEVVGVGQPVAVQFDENITDRLAAQKAIKITTNPPVEGAFYWLNNREVRWRPAQYWKPGTTVDVAVNIYGADLGDGLFGQQNISTRFTIGDELIATADDNTKIVTVRRNGEVIKT